MNVFLILIIVAFVLGLIGAVADGLGWVLAVGCLVFLADLGYGWRLLRGRAGSGRRPVR
jgi:ABC-type iron transport system FetAB permease component